MCVETMQTPERLCRTTWQVRYTEFFSTCFKEILIIIVKLRPLKLLFVGFCGVCYKYARQWVQRRYGRTNHCKAERTV